MKGITRDALNWALGELSNWAEHDPPGQRVKQVIYRLLLLRAIGVTKRAPANAFSTGDFRDHCARFLRVSVDDLVARTRGKARYFVPTTCDWALAEGGSDFAVGTMWTRCQTWSNNGIISWPESGGSRSIKFASDYATKLAANLEGVRLPGLPLALFLLRDPASTEISLEEVSTPAEVVASFRSAFHLEDRELERLIDFSVGACPFEVVVGPSALSPPEVLAMLLEKTPLGEDEESSEYGDESGTASAAHRVAEPIASFDIGVSERKGASSYPLQVLVHGCPGSGKSHLLKTWAENISRSFTVVLHPETTYGDFVGVYRPLTIYRGDRELSFRDDAGRARTHGEPCITYEFVPGPLLRAYCTAWRNPAESVALIVEEISRGNASLVFGDLLQLLDRSERDVGGFEAGVSTFEVHPRSEILAFLARNQIPLADRGVMRFPSNLHIWATMNRSDQNARQLDAAFLRRWDKKHLSYMVPCSYGGKKLKVPGGEVTWDQLRGRINTALEGLVPEDKFVGPYFLPERRLADPSSVAEDLLGYLWNDVLKSRAKDVFAVTTLTEALEVWSSGSRNPFRSISLP